MSQPKQLGQCPTCGLPSVDAKSWTNHDGEPDGVAFCVAQACGWSSTDAPHHKAKAQRHQEEDAARNAWFAEQQANPDLCPL